MVKAGILAVVLGVTLVAAETARIDVPSDASVCLPSHICVPVAVLETEFKGYTANDPPPSLLLRQQLIDVSTAYASEVERRSALQSQANAQGLKEAQAALDAAFAASAPDGMAWDPAQRKYLKKKVAAR